MMLECVSVVPRIPPLESFELLFRLLGSLYPWLTNASTDLSRCLDSSH